eukprot:251130-Amphidinium_carterae.1
MNAKNLRLVPTLYQSPVCLPVNCRKESAGGCARNGIMPVTHLSATDPHSHRCHQSLDDT